MIVLPRSPRLVRIGSAAALLLALAGCTPGGQFDPTTIFDNDMFVSKKKLEGQRQAVFPNGVPGASSGVPQDLVKGYQPPPEQAADANPPPAAAPAAKPKPTPKPKVARAPPGPPPTRINVGPTPSQGTPAAQGAPSQQAAQPSQSVWPNPPAPKSPSQ